MSKKNKELPEFINIGELYEGKTKRAKQWLSGALSEAKKMMNMETNNYIAIILPNNTEGAIQKFNSEKEARKYLDRASDMLYIKLLIKGQEIPIKKGGEK